MFSFTSVIKVAAATFKQNASEICLYCCFFMYKAEGVLEIFIVEISDQLNKVRIPLFLEISKIILATLSALTYIINQPHVSK